jgi:hypothetical protein
MVLHNMAANFARARYFCAMSLMVSGSTPWKPPPAATIVKTEAMFFSQLKETIVRRWVADGVLMMKNSGGRQVPVLRWPPLLSITFDISTTKTSTGLSSISIRTTWLNKNWKRQMVSLGVQAVEQGQRSGASETMCRDIPDILPGVCQDCASNRAYRLPVHFLRFL